MTDLCVFTWRLTSVCLQSMKNFITIKDCPYFFLPVGATEFWQHLIISEFLHHWGFRIANKVWMKANPNFVTLFQILGKAGWGTLGLGWSKNQRSSLWGIPESINVFNLKSWADPFLNALRSISGKIKQSFYSIYLCLPLPFGPLALQRDITPLQCITTSFIYEFSFDYLTSNSLQIFYLLKFLLYLEKLFLSRFCYPVCWNYCTLVSVPWPVIYISSDIFFKWYLHNGIHEGAIACLIFACC